MNTRPVFGGTLITVAICPLLGLPASAPAAAPPSQQPACGTYQHVYPYNTEHLVEDHFIVLECEGGQRRGWYYGTSDEFDRGREGYRPGFFVAEMQELTVSGDSIRFAIHVSEQEYFADPVPLSYEDAQQVPADRLQRWGRGLGAGSRAYEGMISQDSIVLDVDGRRRTFHRMTPG